MRPGEKKTWTVKDKDTGAVVRTVNLTRSNRPYVYDLCDAYNDSMAADAVARGCRWEVMPNGELKLGYPQSFTDENTTKLKAEAERERQQYNHRQAYPMRDAAE